MATNVTAPMPGTIKEVLVKVGDAVQEDDELAILEAMKMENPIVSDVGGTVKEIKVKGGDKVNANDVLIVIE
jgi:biotin carboxyl carrier protein